MTTFKNKCSREVAIERLGRAGWTIRSWQRPESDYEAFIRSDGTKGFLLVDFALSRFILDVDGSSKNLLTHSDDAEGDPPYDAVLHALYDGEVV